MVVFRSRAARLHHLHLLNVCLLILVGPGHRIKYLRLLRGGPDQVRTSAIHYDRSCARDRELPVALGATTQSLHVQRELTRHLRLLLLVHRLAVVRWVGTEAALQRDLLLHGRGCDDARIQRRCLIRDTIARGLVLSCIAATDSHSFS